MSGNGRTRTRRHDDPALPRSVVEDGRIRGVQTQHLTHVDRIVAGLAQLLDDDPGGLLAPTRNLIPPDAGAAHAHGPPPRRSAGQQ